MSAKRPNEPRQLGVLQLASRLFFQLQHHCLIQQSTSMNHPAGLLSLMNQYINENYDDDEVCEILCHVINKIFFSGCPLFLSANHSQEILSFPLTLA